MDRYIHTHLDLNAAIGLHENSLDSSTVNLTALFNIPAPATPP